MDNICAVAALVLGILLFYMLMELESRVNEIFRKYDALCKVIDIAIGFRDDDGTKRETKDFIDDLLGDDK